jgi:hypothetical protein
VLELWDTLQGITDDDSVWGDDFYPDPLDVRVRYLNALTELNALLGIPQWASSPWDVDDEPAPDRVIAQGLRAEIEAAYELLATRKE